MKIIKIGYVQYVAYTLITIIAAGYILNIGQFVLAPLVFAGFLSIALTPILNQIQKKIKSELWSVVLLLTLCFLVLGGIGLVIGSQFMEFFNQYEGLSDKVIRSMENLKDFLKKQTNYDLQFFQDLILSNSKELIDSGSKTALSLANNVSNFLFYLFLIPFYTFFLLLYRESINKILKRLLNNIHLKYKSVVDNFSSMIQNYFKGMLILMLIMGSMNSLGLYLLEVPYPLALGFFLALFSIIPYVGVIIGGFFILIISYATQGSITTLGLIVGLIALTQFIEGNFLTPYILGDRLNVNTLIAILSMFIGGKIWGIAGLLIAIPAVGAIGILYSQLEEDAFYEEEEAET